MTITLNGTTGIASVDGSASSPSVRGADNNTGVYYGTDRIYMSTGGVKRFEISDGGDIQVPDSCKFEWGASQDLQIFHDSSDSYISNTTNTDLIIRNLGNAGIDIKPQNSYPVNLYFNATKRFETTSTGNTSTGSLKVDSGYLWVTGDSQTLRIGAGDGSNGDMEIWHDSGQNYMDVKTGNLTVQTDSSSHFQLEDTEVMWSKTHKPWSGNTYDIGASGVKWNNIYAANGTIQTSDKNEKNTIVDSDLGLSFVNKLKPVSYKFNGRTRTHYGLIAQDVETLLSDISKSTTDFAGFIKTDIPDELYDESRDEKAIAEGKKVGEVKKAAYTTYGLRYSEFISPLIKAVQELSAEVETLKTKVAALEAG